METRTMRRVREMERATRHVYQLAYGNPVHAENYRFRGGPCDVCGGNCLCSTDSELIARLLTGLKPVGYFACHTQTEANELCLYLEGEYDLRTWSGRNRWGMFMVVASLSPETTIIGVGTPQAVAMTQAFIDELVDVRVQREMYGYPVKATARELRVIMRTERLL